MSAAAPLALEVVSGVNVGTRLVVDGQVRMIGRARDADLVLSDLGVSRRHLQLVASPSGILLQACDGAAALMIDGRPYRSFTAELGTQFVVGSTRFVVRAASHDDEVSAVKTNLDTKTMLTGVGASSRSLCCTMACLAPSVATSDQSSPATPCAVPRSPSGPQSSVWVCTLKVNSVALSRTARRISRASP
jgi:pSer/pThr/pTyr-binding forkhead associated (FHA) protein